MSQHNSTTDDSFLTPENKKLLNQMVERVGKFAKSVGETWSDKQKKEYYDSQVEYLSDVFQLVKDESPNNPEFTAHVYISNMLKSQLNDYRIKYKNQNISIAGNDKDSPPIPVKVHGYDDKNVWEVVDFNTPKGGYKKSYYAFPHAEVGGLDKITVSVSEYDKKGVETEIAIHEDGGARYMRVSSVGVTDRGKFTPFENKEQKKFFSEYSEIMLLAMRNGLGEKEKKLITEVNTLIGDSVSHGHKLDLGEISKGNDKLQDLRTAAKKDLKDRTTKGVS